MQNFTLELLETEEYTWLKNSDFYNTLNNTEEEEEENEEEENEEEDNPNKNEQLLGLICTKNTQDINIFLDTGKFWMVNYYPKEFFSLLLKTKPKKYLDELFLQTGEPFYRFLAECLNTNKDELTNIIVKNDRLDFLIWANENNFNIDKDTVNIAIINESLFCLKYLHGNGFISIKFDICRLSSEHGRLKSLKFGHENGYHWDKNICRLSALYGWVECLKYACENGCPWDDSTCYSAAKNNHLNCLKYAHENGCPWNDSTIEIAIYFGNKKCLKYAKENGCPYYGTYGFLKESSNENDSEEDSGKDDEY